MISNYKVHHRPGFFLPIASFEEFWGQPERYCAIRPTRRPLEREGWELEALAARRIIALVEAAMFRGMMSKEHLREIRWRALIAQPHCMDIWF